MTQFGLKSITRSKYEEPIDESLLADDVLEMKPTRIHYFYAQNWPVRIWLTVVASCCVFVSVRACEPSFAMLSDWRSLLWLLGVIITSLLLGWFGAILIGWPILGPLHYSRLLKNGGPFKDGDLVQILVGPHRGRVVRVYSSWKGDSVRVELGEREKETFQDVFHGIQLLREEDTQSGDAGLYEPTE